MKNRFPGVVTRINLANDGLKYCVIEIENSVHLNYRLFIPGEGYKVGQRVFVTVEVAEPAPKKPAANEKTHDKASAAKVG